MEPKMADAVGVVSQAINILKIRQTLTKADRNTLIEGTLEMAQLQCNLSMVSATAATEHHSSERRSTWHRFACVASFSDAHDVSFGMCTQKRCGAVRGRRT
jgi:hypothetical protein